MKRESERERIIRYLTKSSAADDEDSQPVRQTVKASDWKLTEMFR